MANLACGNARLGLNHALTWPISSLFEIPHGLANGVMLPYVLEFTLRDAIGPMSRVALALGETPRSGPQEELASRAVDRVRGLLADLKFPSSFTEDQIDPRRIPEMVEMIMQPGIYSLFRQVNLRVAEREDLTRLYRMALEGWETI
jgi:alcohol dehydrogenase class IV